MWCPCCASTSSQMVFLLSEIEKNHCKQNVDSVYKSRLNCLQRLHIVCIVSQVLSFRLSIKEVALLRQQAQPGESDNQTAQRLMREMLGTYTSSTAFTDLDERIESIVSERFASFIADHNNLLERLQERLQKVEGSLGKYRA